MGGGGGGGGGGLILSSIRTVTTLNENDIYLESPDCYRTDTRPVILSRWWTPLRTGTYCMPVKTTAGRS